VNVTAPIVDSAGVMIRHFRRWVNHVDSLLIIEGHGSPEGLVEALPRKQYMDLSGGGGQVLYIKQLPHIGGDKKLGWVLVG